MAVDMFLKIDGIPGESTDSKHKGEIVLESFSWGESNTVPHTAFIGSGAGTGGAGAGKVSMQDFHFTTKVSKASPKLMLFCANGQHIQNAILTVRKGSASQENEFEFLFFKFTNVIITSVAEAGATDGPPTETASFAFQKINVEYKEQTAAGAVGATVDFAWDLAVGKKV